MAILTFDFRVILAQGRKALRCHIVDHLAPRFVRKLPFCLKFNGNTHTHTHNKPTKPKCLKGENLPIASASKLSNRSAKNPTAWRSSLGSPGLRRLFPLRAVRRRGLQPIGLFKTSQGFSADGCHLWYPLWESCN